jgi:large subunit ribosomal protein L23
MKSAYEIIERPLLTEKSMAGAQQGKYTFRVTKESNKIEIAQAVEQIFSVKVVSVKDRKSVV